MSVSSTNEETETLSTMEISSTPSLNATRASTLGSFLFSQIVMALPKSSIPLDPDSVSIRDQISPELRIPELDILFSTRVGVRHAIDYDDLIASKELIVRQSSFSGEPRTLEQVLKERGLAFADGTDKPGTQATAQAVGFWSRLFGPSDQEIFAFSDSIFALIDDVEAKKTQLSDLLKEVRLAQANLEKTKWSEERVSCAEKLQIANEQYAEGLKEVKDAAWKLKIATDSDARREKRDKGYFKKGDKSDQNLKKVCEWAKEDQKWVDPIYLELVANEEIRTQELQGIIASCVRSSDGSLVSLSKSETRLPGTPPLDRPDQSSQPSTISSFAALTFDAHDLGTLLSGDKEYSSMPLTRHFVLENTKKAISSPQRDTKVPAMDETSKSFFDYIAEINGLDPDQPYVSIATTFHIFNRTLQEPLLLTPRTLAISVPPIDPLRLSLDTGVLGGTFFNAEDLFLGTIKGFGLGVIGVGKGAYGALAFFKNKVVIQQIEKQLIKLEPFAIQHTLNAIPRVEGIKLLEFTKGNHRQNLMRVTGIDPGSTVAHAHHSIPKNWADSMAEIGINVHDPKFAAWWEARTHLQNAQEYNRIWSEFFLKDPTISEIFNQALEMAETYNFKTNL